MLDQTDTDAHAGLLGALTVLMLVGGAAGACGSDAPGGTEIGTTTEDADPPASTGAGDTSSGGDETSGSSSDGEVGSTADEEPPPMCDDDQLNGDEEDVDCGGSCQACPPPQWTCDATNYGDGVCHCGCAVIDVDCPSDDVSACAYDLCPDGQALDPGQTLVCVEVPEVPTAWTCTPARYGDSVCDCGCGVGDFDCESPVAADCVDVHCPDFFSLDPDDNGSCVPPPETAVLNPSFEDAPSGFGDVPGWTVLADVGGMASVAVVGAGQTAAPDGSQALWLESLNDTLVGARTVRSSPFLPPPGTCIVTVAVGDSNTDSEYADFGQLRIRAPEMTFPLDLVAEVDIDNRGQGGISPPVDGYTDATLSFSADGSSVYQIDIRVRGSYGRRSYHADDVRIACTAR